MTERVTERSGAALTRRERSRRPSILRGITLVLGLRSVTGAMRKQSVLRRYPAPVLTAVLLLLLAIAIGFGGKAGDGQSRPSVAQVSRTRAELADGECEFSANVWLTSRWSSFTFSMRQQTIRRALVEVLRTKSSYMVDSSPAREALRHQMLATVNDILGAGRATDLRFTSFDLL